MYLQGGKEGLIKEKREENQFLLLLIFPSGTVTKILAMTHKMLDGILCKSCVRGCLACPRNALVLGFLFEMKTIQVNLEDKLSRQMEAEEFKEDNHSVP